MAEDRRAARTRRVIKQVAREMIVEHPGQRITVKELAERADINRKTFYLHYTCVEDLFEDLLTDVLTRYDEQMSALPTPLFIADTNRVFFTFFAQQDEWFQVMVCDEAYAPYVNRMLYGSLRQNRSRSDTISGRKAAERSLINHFIVDTSLSLYRYWRQSGTSLTLDEAIDLTGRLLENGLSAVRD